MKSGLHKWNMAFIAVIAFAVGAVLTNFLMRHSLVNPESQYFSKEEVSQVVQRQFAARFAAERSKWLGVETTQNPLDMWMLQEIISEIKPDVVVETGTGRGGSALAFATLLDALRHGQVHTVGVDEDVGRPRHSRIAYYTGSSTDAKIFGEIRSKVRESDRALVVLNSTNEPTQMLRELNLYAPLVSVGSYIVAHNVAVADFLKQNRNFEVDQSRERFGVTANPSGWLKRVR